MVLNKFRQIGDKIVSSQVKLLVKWRIKPNLISLLGLIFGLITAVSFALPDVFINSLRWAWIPPVLYFISGYLDFIDGGVARESGTSTSFGGFLDSTLDRIGDVAVIIGLMIGNMLVFGIIEITYIIGFITLTVTILISYTRSRAENEGVIMKGVGLMERGERFFALLLGFIVEAILRAVNPSYNHYFFPIFFCVYLALCTYTVIARVIHSYKWLTGKVSKKYLEKQGISYEDKKEE
jgi:archaetidylinositol phosphate synthase